MMISISGDDDKPNVEALSEWLARPGGNGGPLGPGYLREITGGDGVEWGGYKLPECDIWAGALNYADHDAVLDKIRQISWKRPTEVQVFLMGQEDRIFQVWAFRDGHLTQYI